MEDKEKVRLRNKSYYEKNKEKVLAHNKEWRAKNTESYLLKNQEYRRNNKESVKTHKQKKYQENNGEISIDRKKYYLDNAEQLKEKRKIYYQKNQKDIVKQITEYRKNRLSKDPLFALLIRYRGRTNRFFKSKGIKKQVKSLELIGCSLSDLKLHFEKLFIEGMGWHNMGEWHIDHKIPLSSAKCEEELKLLCHYSNLQPLWAKDNLSKGSKIL